jgi:sporulation protein YlmC with PRC-barrel domain
MTRTFPIAVQSADALTGRAVKNRQGEDLGHITDLMIDVNRGQVVYAVLSFGWIPGIGGKLFAVPWGALRMDADRSFFVLDADKSQLRNAPGFEKDRGHLNDRLEWHRELHSFYKQPPYWESLENYQG